MIRSRFVIACALVCALGGCKSLLKKREAVTTEASASAAVAPASAPTLAASAPVPAATAAVADADDAIPTSQDFEDEALEKVTAANFKTELTRLKKEIEKK